MTRHLLILLFAWPLVSHAGTGVLDWESSGCMPVHVSGGLEFTNARGTICTRTNFSPSNGTTTSNDVSGLVARHMAGIPFTPVSIDLAEYSSVFQFKKAIPLTFTGHRAGSEPVSVTFTIDGLVDDIGGTEDFQTFQFPASFADITELRGPAAQFSCDNFVFDTVVPPPFPDEFQLMPTAYQSYGTIHSRGVHTNDFVVGPDFAYHTGFGSGNNLHVLGESPSVETGISNLFVDPASHAVFYRSGSSLFRKSTAGREELVTLQEVTGAGITAGSLGKPVPYGKDFLFLAYDLHGSDAYRLLRKSFPEKSPPVISILVEPGTLLPLPGSTSGTPHYFPDFLAASADSFAFDTSVSGSTQVQRVYAAFGDGQPLRPVLSEGDLIDTGLSLVTVSRFLALEFATDGNLEITADTTGGAHILRYGPTDAAPSSVERIGGIVIAPENTGTQRTGTIHTAANGTRILESPYSGNASESALFREHGGRWHRVIGVGDTLGGGKIAYLDYLATPSGAPDRIIVDVRFESSGSVSHNIILHLGDPAIIPPRIGRPEIESGHLFIPIDRLTHGKRYFLSTSADMSTWTDDGPDLEIKPAQHLIVFPQNLVSPMFFRVAEKAVE